MGFEDGSVVVVDAETGAEIARHLDAGEAHDKQVTCLHWAEDLGGHGAGANPHANSTHADDEQQYSSDDDVDGGAWRYEDRAPRFFPPLRRPPPAPGSAEAAAAFDTAAAGAGAEASAPLGTGLQAPERLSVLVSADAGGRVVLSAAGALVLGVLELGEALGEGAEGAAAALGPRLDWLLLAARRRRGALSGVVVRTPLLRARRAELRVLAHQAAVVRTLLKAARQGTAAALRAWEEARAPFRTALDKLTRLARDHGEAPREAPEALIPLLTSGTTSHALQQWLGTTLTESAARRMAREAAAAGDHAQTLLADYTAPAAEELVFRLGELLGLARCAGQLAPLGLREDAVQRALAATERLMLHVEGVRSQAAAHSAGYANVLAGLARAAKALDADAAPAPSRGRGAAPAPADAALAYDAVAATDFMRTCLLHDRVAAALGDGGGSKMDADAPLEEEEDARFDFGLGGDASPAPATAAAAAPKLGGAAADEATLVDTLREAADAMAAAFAGARDAVTPTLVTTAVVPLVGEGEGDDAAAAAVACERATSGSESLHCTFAAGGGAHIGVLRAKASDLEVAVLSAPGVAPRVADLAVTADAEVVSLSQCGAGQTETETEFAAVRGVELLEFAPVKGLGDTPVLAVGGPAVAPQDAESEELGMLVRRRTCGSGFVSAGPLAVGQRGMALAALDAQRVLILDVEEDEEEEEYEEG